jgi:prepilin-type N-terminal cleavage/methylation domain-containing protein
MKLNRQESSLEKGFTLLELMVVIAIIAILAALTLGGFKYANEASARNRTITTHAVIKAGLEQYKEKHGEYPEPNDPTTTTEVANQSIRVGGARMLYQALTGDGDSEIKLASPQGNVSDGKMTDEERENTINAELMNTKNLVVKSSEGYYMADGWMRPFQYEKGGTDGASALNPTYDLWSFGTAGLSGGGLVYDAESRRSVETTAKWVKNW